jgi:serine/threonine protein kinase
VLAHIGSGGMSTVYRALDPDSGRQVALKVLPPELVAGKPALIERFRREALHGAKLHHENIVALYEFGEVGGAYFHVMELVEGGNLTERIENEGPFEPEEARQILVQMAYALDHAHGQGIVHRDIKPANILLAQKDGRSIAKLTDLGLAREVRDDEFRITREGCTVGTVDYMAPEQARNSTAADIRSDIYSLGCTFFHMLAGVPPFGKGTISERIYQHAEAEPPDIQTVNPRVSMELSAVLRRMLAKHPSARYQTPAELLAALQDLTQPARSAQRVVRWSAPNRRRSEEASSSAQQRISGLASGPPAAGEAFRSGPVPTSSGNVRIAAGQFAWAREQLARGNRSYGIELLLACCRFDPANLEYHQALRQALDGEPLHRRGGWLGWVRGLASWVRFKFALRCGNHLQVLGRGAEMVARNPANLTAQLDMAAAAEKLGDGDLTLWLLEQARTQDSTSPAVNRALARYHEIRKNYSRALVHWEKVAKGNPLDHEAAAKLRDLAALQTLERARQRQSAGRGQGDKVTG